MNKRTEDYTLGENVTEQARAKSKKGTVVFSVRLSVAELRHLEEVSKASGSSVSQVARDAITAYTAPSLEQKVLTSLQDGSSTGPTMMTGPIIPGTSLAGLPEGTFVSGAAEAEVLPVPR